MFLASLPDCRVQILRVVDHLESLHRRFDPADMDKGRRRADVGLVQSLLGVLAGL